MSRDTSIPQNGYCRRYLRLKTIFCELGFSWIFGLKYFVVILSHEIALTFSFTDNADATITGNPEGKIIISAITKTP